MSVAPSSFYKNSVADLNIPGSKSAQVGNEIKILLDVPAFARYLLVFISCIK